MFDWIVAETIHRHNFKNGVMLRVQKCCKKMYGGFKDQFMIDKTKLCQMFR